jgi:hypothetical protein
MRSRCRCRHSCFLRLTLYLLLGFVMGSLILFITHVDIRSLATQYHEASLGYRLDKTDLDDAKMKWSGSQLQLYPDDYFNSTNLACRYPRLTIDNADVWKHLDAVKEPEPVCEKASNWVYVENGELIVLV